MSYTNEVLIYEYLLVGLVKYRFIRGSSFKKNVKTSALFKEIIGHQ